ncbi:aldolase [Microthyrium microscopicum]|uniref:Aldolase n=1 Tax=Microthyrium microscopicum TaxID=703497 RepID=A0A6A6U401_9PEZI|nr:aldolase [Microthyrium microscopicum]
MTSPPPKGIYVPVPTFFKADASRGSLGDPVDLDSQTQHAIFLARAGITGLVLLGSTGEAVHLTTSERTDIIGAVRQGLVAEGFPNYPLMAGTAAQSIHEVVQQLADAKTAGADFGLVLAPSYFATNNLGQEGIADWFKVVADHSPIPILVYNYPAVSNDVTLLPSTIEKLAAHPNIVGCKLSHGNLSTHTLVGLSPKIDHTNFRMYTGLGQQLLGVLTVGGAGAIDGLAACFPKTVVQLYNLFMDGEHGTVEQASVTRARELQYKICQGELLVAKWGSVGVRKLLKEEYQIGSDGSRAPLSGGITSNEWGQHKEAIEMLRECESKIHFTGSYGKWQ